MKMCSELAFKLEKTKMKGREGGVGEAIYASDRGRKELLHSGCGWWRNDSSLGYRL